MAGTTIQTCIAEDEKYALIGLQVEIEGEFEYRRVAPQLWTFVDTSLSLPAPWREWLGTIRSEQTERYNLFLLSKSPSARPQVLDLENDELWRRVGDFYSGLLLASPFAPAHRPVQLTGCRRNSTIEVRQQQDLDTPAIIRAKDFSPVRPKDLDEAAIIAESLEFLRSTSQPGSTWKIFQTLRVYMEGRTRRDILDRIHQFCRCIDGLIDSEPGKTTKRFRSRTELLIGSRYHVLMGELYAVRSAVEHLHIDRYLEPFDRNVRLDRLKKEAIAEHIARTTLAKILSDRSLLAHFANSNALAAFWSLPLPQQRGIWGDPVDPFTALADFNPKYVTDGELGLR